MIYIFKKSGKYSTRESPYKTTRMDALTDGRAYSIRDEQTGRKDGTYGRDGQTGWPDGRTDKGTT